MIAKHENREKFRKIRLRIRLLIIHFNCQIRIKF